MRFATALVLLLAGASQLSIGDETTVANHWTLLNTVEACSLAQAADVQKELKLTARQAGALKQLVDTWRKRNHEFRKANKRPSAADCQKQYDALIDDVKAIVSLEQLHRLRQIQWQCDGIPAVVLNHEQSERLFQLTKEQRHKLTEIEVGSGKQRADAFTKRMAENKNPLELFKGGSGAETQLLREKNKQALALLDEKQQKAWEELIGKPFTGRLVNAKGKKVHPQLESLRG